MCVFLNARNGACLRFFCAFRNVSLLASVRAVAAVRTWLYFKSRHSALDRVLLRAIKRSMKYVCVGKTDVFGIPLLQMFPYVILLH